MRGHAVWLAAFAGAALWGQGIATRGVKPVPRGKPSGLPFHARFVNVAREAGLRQVVIYGREDRKDYILESVGCGAAWIDYDDDGWLDALILTGTKLESDPPEATIRLYRNQRDGTFADVTVRAGLKRAGWASSVALGDYDGDGDTDFFLTFWGDNALYRNNGDGTFTDVARAAGLVTKERHWGSGATFLDFDRDGKLDLFTGSYLVFDPARVPKPGQSETCKWKGVDVNCGPRGLPAGRGWLYRNQGDGTFRDVSERSGIASAKGSYLMTAVAADFDNDGWPDLYVASDSTSSYYFRNNHDGTFSEQGLERGVALNEDGMEQAGMGLGIGDYNLDGGLDIFKTHFSDDTNVLYRNNGAGNFDDVTIATGLGVETRFVGWGAAISDFDNDGWPDLFYVTGSVYPEMEAKLPAYPFRTPSVLFRSLGVPGSGGVAASGAEANRPPRFEELIEQAGPALAEAHAARGAAFGDYDNDGDLDVLVVSLSEPPGLFRNDLTAPEGSANWLAIRNVPVGTRVVARYGGKTQAQEALSQSSFYSSNGLRLHFGLGAAREAVLEIRWTDGKVQHVGRVAAGQVVDARGWRGAAVGGGAK